MINLYGKGNIIVIYFFLPPSFFNVKMEQFTNIYNEYLILILFCLK